MTTERRGFPIGLTISAAIAFLILIALGTWQVQRLHWKEGLLARIAALQAAPARPIEPVLDRLAAGADVDFTRVTADCPGLATAPYVELYALREGQAGVRLISACKAPSARYGAILVDRGFVADTVSARPPVDPANQAPFRITGVLRVPDRANWFTPKDQPRLWFRRDPDAMAHVLGVRAPAPVFLFAETPTNPEWKGLVPAPVPADIPNNHLQYAVTWYGLAAALLGVYAAMLFRRQKN
jgi:surfeit locus 1 family protein